jgi:DNA-binding response OmpR family regulator
MSAEAKRAERRGGGWPRRRRRLLLVDEDAWCRGIADGILRASGYRVVCTGDAATAVGIARNMLPDLVLADVRLDLIEAVPFLERRRHDGAAVLKPVSRITEGYAVLRPLEVDPDLVSCPVVVLRDANETEDPLDGPRFGVPDYLAKPFTAEVLLEKVERSLHTTGLGEALSGAQAIAPALRARRDSDPWNPHEALMSGTLDFVGVPAVLEMFHFNQLSGVCALRTHDGRSAEVGFEEGEIVTATTSDGLGGADAVFQIVAWTRGRFAFTRARPIAATPLKTRFEQLILEGLRRLDEQRRGGPALALDTALKGLNFRES